MVFFLQILANYAGLIYLACAIGIALYLREIFAARLDPETIAVLAGTRAAAMPGLARRFVIFVLTLLAGSDVSVVDVRHADPVTDQPATTPTAVYADDGNPAPTLQPSPTRTPRH
jgi:hypothetical protein